MMDYEISLVDDSGMVDVPLLNTKSVDASVSFEARVADDAMREELGVELEAKPTIVTRLVANRDAIEAFQRCGKGGDATPALDDMLKAGVVWGKVADLAIAIQFFVSKDVATQEYVDGLLKEVVGALNSVGPDDYDASGRVTLRFHAQRDFARYGVPYQKEWWPEVRYDQKWDTPSMATYKVRVPSDALARLGLAISMRSSVRDSKALAPLNDAVDLVAGTLVASRDCADAMDAVLDSAYIDLVSEWPDTKRGYNDVELRFEFEA